MPRGLFCGPNLSLCYVILSVWGVIMLCIMGALLRGYAPAFFEDLDLDDWKNKNWDPQFVYDKYNQASTNCFIAAGLYLVIFGVSLWQQRLNAKKGMATD